MVVKFETCFTEEILFPQLSLNILVRYHFEPRPSFQSLFLEVILFSIVWLSGMKNQLLGISTETFKYLQRQVIKSKLERL